MRRKTSKLMPYAQARTYARSLRCPSVQAWRAHCAGGGQPRGIPSSALIAYRRRGEWVSWQDFLGLAKGGALFVPFAQAKTEVRALRLKSQAQWKEYCAGRLLRLGTRPPHLPASPDEIYAQAGWVSWGDFLGNNALAGGRKRFLPYRAAAAFARTLGLAREADWQAYRGGGRPDLPSLPALMPRQPSRYYQTRGGWVSWRHYLVGPK